MFSLFRKIDPETQEKIGELRKKYKTLRVKKEQHDLELERVKRDYKNPPYSISLPTRGRGIVVSRYNRDNIKVYENLLESIIKNLREQKQSLRQNIRNLRTRKDTTLKIGNKKKKSIKKKKNSRKK